MRPSGAPTPLPAYCGSGRGLKRGGWSRGARGAPQNGRLPCICIGRGYSVTEMQREGHYGEDGRMPGGDGGVGEDHAECGGLIFVELV